MVEQRTVWPQLESGCSSEWVPPMSVSHWQKGTYEPLVANTLSSGEMGPQPGERAWAGHSMRVLMAGPGSEHRARHRGWGLGAWGSRAAG